MFKTISVVFVALFFIGCAHYKQNTVGGMHSDLETGFTVYHQYNMVTVHLNQKDKVVHASNVFPADLNEYLPSNVHKLELSMAIINPYKQKFTIWERVNYIDLKSKKLYYKSERLRYTSKRERITEELFSIKLPITSKENCQVLITVDVKNDRGETVYTTYTARYKLKN
jgi:hypothetical protein